MMSESFGGLTGARWIAQLVASGSHPLGHWAIGGVTKYSALRPRAYCIVMQA